MNNTFFKRTWAEINIDALTNNYRQLRRAVNPQTKIMSVVKADAYGHGVRNVALCLQNEGSDWFAVSSIDEACQLRQIGITRPVLILGYTPPEQVDILSINNFTQAIYGIDYAVVLSEFALQKKVSVNCHIKIDCGMGRIGFVAQNSESVDEIVKSCSLPGLNCSGIFTHFPSADFDGDPDGTFTEKSFEMFKSLINKLKSLGVEFELHHCCNSAASIAHPEMQLDMVREGIALYGLWPSSEIKDRVNTINLQPVMELKTIVTHIKTVQPGDSVSYGRTYIAEKPVKVATVCIGYADGYYRCLSGGCMLVNGQRAEIIGRVCMDQLMLDVTGIENVKRGDIVTVIGKDGNDFISVDELALKAGTINYEVVSDLSKRVPRIYLKDEKISNITNYINE